MTKAKDLDKNTNEHLNYLKINGSVTEKDLIINRLNLNETEFSICPKHRFKYGIRYQPSKLCIYHKHVFKKNITGHRQCSIELCKKLTSLLKCNIIIGSKLCHKCYIQVRQTEHSTKVKNTTESQNSENSAESPTQSNNSEKSVSDDVISAKPTHSPPNDPIIPPPPIFDEELSNPFSTMSQSTYQIKLPHLLQMLLKLRSHWYHPIL